MDFFDENFSEGYGYYDTLEPTKDNSGVSKSTLKNIKAIQSTASLPKDQPDLITPTPNPCHDREVDYFDTMLIIVILLIIINYIQYTKLINIGKNINELRTDMDRLIVSKLSQS